MTTTVIIQAHCDPEKKEVEVKIYEAGHPKAIEIIEDFKLQDGDSAERVVFDSRTITVREVEK